MKFIAPFYLLCVLFGCKTTQVHQEVKIAFMADVHFAEVYPPPETLPPHTLPTNDRDEAVLIRTMEAQLHSTRLFNENYFALTAALEDAASRGIKIIAMPGDFSDDGQPLHIKGLNKIMKAYADKYQMSFMMINGNHDPTRPFGKDGGKRDFLGAHGKAQPVMGREGLYASDLDKENPVLVFDGLREWGYAELAEELRAHGFFPNGTYRYWATPFSAYHYESYALASAQKAAQLDRRTYNFDRTGTLLPDLSYLVEPVNGLWLLALDANVYVPEQGGTGFNGAGIGYNEVLKHKEYLLEWTGKVVKEAKRLGKTLIAFSHYPMVDFNDGTSVEMNQLFGATSFQAHRIPGKLVGETFADLGLKVHVGGHMHLNDTGILKTAKGNTLVNIQAPSLAAYTPGYKIITVTSKDTLTVETIVLDTVPGYDTFFDSYSKEHSFLASNYPDRVWDKNILNSTSYSGFADTHLKELVRVRFLKDDWPRELREQLVGKSGWQVLTEATEGAEKDGVTAHASSTEGRILKLLKKSQLTKSDFLNWYGEDLITDFYRFRSGDQLAYKDIDSDRIKAYSILFQVVSGNERSQTPLQQFIAIFQKQMNGEPAVHFTLDLENGEIRDVFRKTENQ